MALPGPSLTTVLGTPSRSMLKTTNLLMESPGPILPRSWLHPPIACRAACQVPLRICRQQVHFMSYCYHQLVSFFWTEVLAAGRRQHDRSTVYITLADGTTWNISPRTKFLSVPVGNRRHVSADPTPCRYLYPGPRHDSIYSQSTSYLLLMAPARVPSRTMVLATSTASS